MGLTSDDDFLRWLDDAADRVRAAHRREVRERLDGSLLRSVLELQLPPGRSRVGEAVAPVAKGRLHGSQDWCSEHGGVRPCWSCGEKGVLFRW